MGCNCKKAQRIEKKFPEFAKKNFNKKGVKYLFNLIKDFFDKILGACFIFIVGVILMPIIIYMLIHSFLFKGQMTITLPNLKKLSQKLQKN